MREARSASFFSMTAFSSAFGAAGCGGVCPTMVATVSARNRQIAFVVRMRKL
jgi:hypothetical protein